MHKLKFMGNPLFVNTGVKNLNFSLKFSLAVPFQTNVCVRNEFVYTLFSSELSRHEFC